MKDLLLGRMIQRDIRQTMVGLSAVVEQKGDGERKREI